MKKILSLVLALVLTLSVLPMVFAAEEPVEVSPYQTAVDFLKDVDLYHGDGQGDAALEDVTRWQMALFVSRFITGETNDDFWKTDVNDSGFTDVENFEGACEATLGAISFASQKGIVNGIGGGLFDPSANVTYQDAIVMIVRALGFNFKSSGYPWSYINQARELGILDGISGIAYTEAAPRGVIAQLLYNAFFAEVTNEAGKTFTVASDVFGVSKGIVMITATNDRFFEGNGNKVTRQGYVQFKFLENGTPAGAAYHVPATVFGLAVGSGITEDDKAVGTTYFVYYKDGQIKGTPVKLSKEFVNNPTDGNQFSVSGNSVTADGVTYSIVREFSDMTHAAGTDFGSDKEVKLYYAFGGTKLDKTHSRYLVAANGSIYDVTYSITDPIVYYNAVLDIYYEKDGQDEFNILSYDQVYNKYIKVAQNTNGAFSSTSGVSTLYMKLILSDASETGAEKFAILRNYYFGRINFWYDNGAKKDMFTVTAGGNGNWGFGDSTNYVTGEYTFTGMPRYANGSSVYAIYYIDEYNKEIDIVDVATEGVTGYVRGYNVDANTLNIEGTDVAYGYDALAGSPIFTKNKGSNNAYLLNNLTKVRELLNRQVKTWELNGKVFYIEQTGGLTNDFIVIDKVVSYAQDGIVVNAYTTVNDAYKEIKITNFNGWQLGGYDANYYFYFLAGILTETQQNLVNPVETYKLYRVISADNDNYDIVPAEGGTDVTITVHESGLITGITSAAYAQTSESDYWLILIPAYKETANDEEFKPAKVYAYSGKLGAVTFTGVDEYKETANDYVFIAQLNDDGTLVNPDLLNTITDVTSSDAKYMVYSLDPYKTAYGNVYIYNQPLGYSVLMANLRNGANEYVTWNPYDATIYFKYNEADNKIIPCLDLEEGSIYKVVDGQVVGKYNGDPTEIVTGKFRVVTDQYGVNTYAAGTTLNDIKDDVFAYNFTASMMPGVADTDAAFTKYLSDVARKKVTTFAVIYNATYGIYEVKKDTLPAVASGEEIQAAYLIHSDNSVEVWLFAAAQAPTTAQWQVTTYTAGSVDLDTTDVQVDATVDTANDTLTLVITLPTSGQPMIAYDSAADTALVFNNAEGGTVTETYGADYIESLTVVIDDATATSATVTITGRASGSDVTITVEP